MVSTRLADHTTLRLGGQAERLIEARTEPELIAAVRDCDARGEPLLLLAGGSNLVVADAGFPGTAVLVRSSGVVFDGETVSVAAGEPWDALVARCAADGRAAIACLSGIPGSAGATPIQNVGAYGQEVAQTIDSVRALDRSTGEVVTLTADDLRFGYRTSELKRTPGRHVVLEVRLRLAQGPAPVAYGELARQLGVQPGDRVEAPRLREAVLALRRAKGMVLDPTDPDTRSAGSFFTNPILSTADFAALERRVRERLGDDAAPPRFPGDRPQTVKTSAAWLIERAGFAKGYGDPGGAAISTKHVLALTNRGGASTSDLLALAHEIADGVEQAFAVRLVPEPVFAGTSW